MMVYKLYCVNNCEIVLYKVKYQYLPWWNHCFNA